HRRRRSAVVPGEARGGGALPHLRRAAAAQDRRLRTAGALTLREGRMQNPLRDGLQGERVPAPCTMVIFGASGDLTKRQLGPALYSLARDRLLPSAFNVVGVARRETSHEEFRKQMRESCDKFARRRPVEDSLWSTFADGMFYLPGTFEDPVTYQRLKQFLDDLDEKRGTHGNRVYYLS